MGVPVGPGAGFGRGVGGATTAGTIAAGVMVDTPGRLGGIDRVGSMGPFCASKNLIPTKYFGRVFRTVWRLEVTYWCTSIFIVDPGLETMTCRNSE